MLALAASLRALTHLLALAALRIQLRENGVLAIAGAHALTLVHLSALALSIGALLFAHAGAVSADRHDGTSVAVATRPGGTHVRIVGVVNDIDRA